MALQSAALDSETKAAAKAAPWKIAELRAAVAAAVEMGFPVALKAAAPGFGNRLELGALHLDLADADAVRQAALATTERLGDRVGGLLVQPNTSFM